jgi:hypothetical protein
MGHSPATLRAAAVVQAVESAVVLVATILVGIDTAAGRSYHQNSGIALTVIGVACAAALALVAAGLARARRWSRTPALLTQLFVGIVGIYLLQSHRLDWGVMSVVLAGAGFAALLAPPSLRALAAQEEAQAETEQAQKGQARTGQARAAQAQKGQAGKGQAGKGQAGKGQAGKGQAGNEPGPARPAGGASRRRSARPGAE